MPQPMPQEAASLVEACFVFTRDAARMLVSVEARVERLLGYSADQLTSAEVDVLARVHPDDTDVLEKLFSEPVPRADAIAHLRMRRANGQMCCLRAVYSGRTEAGRALLDLCLQCVKTLPPTLVDAAATVNFQALMDACDDYVFFKDRNHVFTGTSQSMVTFCPGTQHWSELLGLTDYDLFPEHIADHYYRLEKQIFAGADLAEDVQPWMLRDGTHGWGLNRKTPIRDADGQVVGIYGIARDISEQRALADALLKVTDFAARMHGARSFDDAVDFLAGMFQADQVQIALLEPGSTLCRIIAAHGKRRGELLGRLHDLHGTACEQVMRSGVACCLASGAQQSFPDDMGLAAIGADGYFGQPLHDASGSVIGLVAMLRRDPIADVPALRAAMQVLAARVGDELEQSRQLEALRALEARLRLLFDSMAQGVVFQDVDGKVTSVNPAALRILGLSLEEMLGIDSLDPRWMMRAEDGTPIEGKDHPAMQALRQGEVVGPVLASVDAPARGGRVWLSITATPLLKPGDARPSQVYALFEDVTERRAAEQELARLEGYRQLLLSLSMAFVGLPMEQYDVAVDSALQRVGAYFDADRAYLFEYFDQEQFARNTHEWCAEGVSPQRDQLQRLEMRHWPGWMREHRQGTAIVMDDVPVLPEGQLRDQLQAQGIVSLIAVPLMDAGRCIGFVGLDSVRRKAAFAGAERSLLELFAQLLASLRMRERAETDLRESRAASARLNGLLQAILESPQDMMMIAADDQLRYLAFNESHRRAMLELWGSSIALGGSILDSVSDPGVRARAEASLRRALRGERFIVERELGEPGPALRVFENRYNPLYSEEGKVIGLTAFTIEVSEHKQRLAELQAYVSLLENAGRMGRLGYFRAQTSTASEPILSVTAREILGLPGDARPSAEDLLQTVAPDYRDVLIDLGKRCVLDGQSWQLECEALLPDARRLWVRLHGEAVRDSAGRIVALQGIIQDIDQRRRIENELVERNWQLKQTSREARALAEARSRFLASTSHEIRSPLAAVLAYVSSFVRSCSREELSFALGPVGPERPCPRLGQRALPSCP